MRQFHIIDEDDDDNNFLCCCEYFNQKNQRSHILGCCCDCEDVDEYFERKLTGRSMPNAIHLNIYRVVQDRCRIPWKGGARTVPLDVVLPFMLLPILACIASINVWCTFIVFLALPFLTIFFTRFFGQHLPLTKFFLSCTLSSGIYLLMIFEYLVVPHLEILLSENFIFLAQVVIGSLFLFSARLTTVKYAGDDGNPSENGAPDHVCKNCRLKCPSDAMHCNTCNFCVTKGEYHCWWLDCCIGGKNLVQYLTGLLLIMSALFYYSYLVLTTACHPFLLFDLLLVPDDCSDVFFDYYIAMCFVGGTYSLIVAIILLVLLIRHLYLALMGFTCHQWSQIPAHEKRCCRRPMPKRLHKEHLQI